MVLLGAFDDVSVILTPALVSINAFPGEHVARTCANGWAGESACLLCPWRV